MRKSEKHMEEHTKLTHIVDRCPQLVYVYVNYLIRTNFRAALISRFSRFVKHREIKDLLKLGYTKIKHAKFNTPL